MNTFVFGHKNPDTDSVCSSIAYAYYKENMGELVEPRILGELRKEAKFVLEYFGVKTPAFLSNVKVQARDLHYDKILPLTEKSSVYEAYMMMEKENIHTLPIVDDSVKLAGIVSIKDIANALIHINDDCVDTTLKSFINVFSEYNPKIILSNKYDMDIKGLLKVFNPLIPKDSIINKDDVMILKHYHKEEFFNKLDSKVSLLILPQYQELTQDELKLLEKLEITVVSLELSSPMIIKKIHQTDSVGSIMRKDKIKYFQLDDYLHDIREAMLKTNFRNYPLVDDYGTYIGMIARRHLLKPGRKKVIMVDHNEFHQSANGIEEANILEIVDHHKIGGITTTEPIQFMNMTVGSTCTIVYELLKNTKIDIPKHIAGCLISGIISDTLYFKSPTCTSKDITAVEDLNKILQLDLEDYSSKLFKAGSSIEGMSLKEIVYNDFKEFNIKGNKIAISQLFTMDIEEIEEKRTQILEYIKDVVKQNSYNFMIFAVTDIVKEGSYIYHECYDESIISQAFETQGKQGDFAKFVVSRKKQILPMLANVIEAV